MGVTEVQVRIPRVTHLPADDVINVWHLGHTAAELSTADQDDAILALARFYAAPVVTPASAVAGFFANYLDLEETEFRLYNVADPTPRAPYRVEKESISIIREGANDLPGEVVVCFSHRAPAVTGEPPARRRGRIYLGPLNTDAIGSAVDGMVPVADDFRETILEAAQRLVLELAPTEMGVYSRGIGTISQGSTTATATADWTPFFVKSEFGWVDNAFDTQRRRGAGATARTAFDL